MDRLEKIARYREERDAEAAALERAKKSEAESLKNMIRNLMPRINNLIETASCCVENNIDIDAYGKHNYSSDFDTWEKGTFVANGISHRVGFFKNNSKIVGMGIINGGACGNIDLYIDGKYVFGTNFFAGGLQAEPRISDMKRFLNVFDEFEKAFYAYVDDIVGTVSLASSEDVASSDDEIFVKNSDTIYVVINIIDREIYKIGTTRNPNRASEMLKDDFLSEFLGSDYTEEDFENGNGKDENWDLTATTAWINNGVKGDYDWYIVEVDANENEEET